MKENCRAQNQEMDNFVVIYLHIKSISGTTRSRRKGTVALGISLSNIVLPSNPDCTEVTPSPTLLHTAVTSVSTYSFNVYSQWNEKASYFFLLLYFLRQIT
jgi:surface polysaccharide O-acyltransferase-like enzyme